MSITISQGGLGSATLRPPPSPALIAATSSTAEHGEDAVDDVLLEHFRLPC